MCVCVCVCVIIKNNMGVGLATPTSDHEGRPHSPLDNFPYCECGRVCVRACVCLRVCVLACVCVSAFSYVFVHECVCVPA